MEDSRPTEPRPAEPRPGDPPGYSSHSASSTQDAPPARLHLTVPAVGLDAYADFHRLPLYRGYVHGVRTRDLGDAYFAALAVPQPLALVREPDNRRDRRAVAVYLAGEGADSGEGAVVGERVGYLGRVDALAVHKLGRRGVPLVARLIGVQSGGDPRDRLALEVSLLYPPHPASDEAVADAEAARRRGLGEVGERPASERRPSADPLSAGHVYPGYYTETPDAR